MALPTASERLQILKKQLEKIIHTIPNADIEFVAKKMLCCSGSDLCQLVHVANMYPVNKIAKAKFFTQTSIGGRCPINEDCDLWHPCPAKATGAVEMTFASLNAEQVCAPAVTTFDLLMALTRMPRTVDPSILKDYEEFCKNYGVIFEEGNISFSTTKEKDIVLNLPGEESPQRSESALPSVIKEALATANGH